MCAALHSALLHEGRLKENHSKQTHAGICMVSKVGHFASKKHFIKNSYTKLFGSHSVEYQNFYIFQLIFAFLKRRIWNINPSYLSGSGERYIETGSNFFIFIFSEVVEISCSGQDVSYLI